MTDAGSAIREETADAQNMRWIRVPREIDVIVLTHSHTDHVWDTPRASKNNLDAPIYVPKGSKKVIGDMVDEAFKRNKARQAALEVDEWYKISVERVERLAMIEKEISSPKVKRGKNANRVAKTISHEEKREWRERLEEEREELEMYLWMDLGFPQNSLKSLYEFIGKAIKPGELEVTSREFRTAIKKEHKRRNDFIEEQGGIIQRDVSLAKTKMKEVDLNTNKKIGEILMWKTNKPLTARFQNSGHMHTVPATQVLYNLWGDIKVLYSGDRGNRQLWAPYAQADDTGLENSADALILESTYGDRIHTEREKELERLDAIILDAVERKEDIIIPCISLDRPVVVMYEIVTRLIKTGKIEAKDIDIYYFGKMLAGFVESSEDHEMMKEIEKYYPNWERLLSPAEFEKSAGKSRLVIAGGGFLPRDGSPAGGVIESALEQDKLTIIIPNYHGGPNSNAGRMLAGEKFQATREGHTHKLKHGQNAYYSKAFSGHEDGPGLVEYARKVIKAGGTIFLNHGDEKSREGLERLLKADPTIREKNITIVLPRPEKEYVIKRAIKPKKKKA